MITWNETRAAIRADRARWRREASLAGAALCFETGFQAVFLYRVSRWLYCRGHRGGARFVWLVNLAMTGADLSPLTRIGGGLYVPHPIGTVIAGAVGANCTFMPQAAIGGLAKAPDKDIGGGPGLPVLGDDVAMEAGALVLGAVSVGAGTRIGPRCLVSQSLQDASEVLPAEWRVVPRKREG